MYAAHPPHPYLHTDSRPHSGENGNGDQVSVAEIEPMLVDNDNNNGISGKNEDDSRGGQNLENGNGGGNGGVEEEDPSQRWRALEKLVSRPSPFGAETGQLAVGEFEPFENVSELRKGHAGWRLVYLHTASRDVRLYVSMNVLYPPELVVRGWRENCATRVGSIGGGQGGERCWLPVDQG